jgi:EpsI family protein
VSPGWRLGIVLGLLAGAVGVVYGTPPVPEHRTPGMLEGLPRALAGWTATDGIPESLLPPDPREAAAVRRTYRSGPRIAWISVALFTRQDEPARRASVDRIHPERDVTLAEPVAITVALEGSSPIRRARVIHRGGEQHAVVYWHQIERRAYGDGYSFRWALMRRIVLDRRGDSVLVRIAVPVDQTDRDAALASVAELGPPLHAALARILGE